MLEPCAGVKPAKLCGRRRLGQHVTERADQNRRDTKPQNPPTRAVLSSSMARIVKGIVGNFLFTSWRNCLTSRKKEDVVVTGSQGAKVHLGQSLGLRGALEAR